MINFVIKLFPEITIKSAPVRKRMSRQLTENLRLLLKRLDPAARVQQDWDKLEVSLPGDSEASAQAVVDLLSCVPGIANYARVRIFPLGDLHNIFEHTLAVWGDGLNNKTFAVRVKRNGEHPFTSGDVERYVGGGLNQHTDARGVDLSNPDVTVRLEVRHDTLYVLDQLYQGLGGFPLGTQEAVLSLISGGFDSTVASYQCIKRGLRTHFLFFNLGGSAHEIAVKEIAFYLWNRFGSTHRVKFITVPFEGVVQEIMEKVDPSCMGVVLKRMMMRAATHVAERAEAHALVTGEAVSQVSSQTLTNLAVIDRVTDHLVLRPLAMMDKGAIIDICRDIGAEEFAANVPEYCGVISVRPSAHLRMHKVEEQEARMDLGALTAALHHARVQSIDAIAQDFASAPEAVAAVSELGANHVVVDIRHPSERDAQPLQLASHPVLTIPFYGLDSEFPKLDGSSDYLLFCDKGVISAMHAAHLRDNGYQNVGVYSPAK